MNLLFAYITAQEAEKYVKSFAMSTYPFDEPLRYTCMAVAVAMWCFHQHSDVRSGIAGIYGDIRFLQTDALAAAQWSYR